MTSAYRRDHIRGVRNDEFDALAEPARLIIAGEVEALHAMVLAVGTPLPSEGERLALRRAMARFLIDSGIASARGWI